MREKFTGIIVDHRLDAEFTAGLCRDQRLAGAKRVYLVNPESRPAQMSGVVYDGWLIRPLREQSLIDVLTGRLKGLEARGAANDDFPVLAAEAQDEEPATAHPAGPGYSILIGEDDPVNAMICQAILEKAGHRARLADTFTKLDAAFAEKRPDLILTDHHMPDGVCLDFIARLRETEAAEGLAGHPRHRAHRRFFRRHPPGASAARRRSRAPQTRRSRDPQRRDCQAVGKAGA